MLVGRGIAVVDVRLEGDGGASRRARRRRGGGVDGGGGGRAGRRPPAARVGGGAAAVDAIRHATARHRDVRAQSGVVSPTAIGGVPSAERLDEPTPRGWRRWRRAVVSPRVVAKTPRAEAARSRATASLGAGESFAAHLPDDGPPRRRRRQRRSRAIGAATVSPRGGVASRGDAADVARADAARNSFRRSRRAGRAGDRRRRVGRQCGLAVAARAAGVAAGGGATRRLYGVNRA